jgi:tRNA A-37 threonylcarbamoyl transferase component Bud32
MPVLASNGVCLCGRYTLLDRVGAGGEGEVWRARDHERGIELALKILDDAIARDGAAWEALHREFAVAILLEHPLILRVYRPQRDRATIVLPMEYAPGGDSGRLRRASYLEIGPVLLEVAQALAHVHSQGFVHRDLKPANVLLDARGHVRLADFSLAARIPGSAPAASSLSVSTQSLRCGFSPFTASPEQLRGEPPSVADDVYGLGALACELLTGRPPDYARFDLTRRHDDPSLRIDPAQPAPERLITLVMSLLSKSANRRPRSMQQIIERLEAALADTLTFGGSAARVHLAASAAEASHTEPAATDRPAVPIEPAAVPRAAPSPASQRIAATERSRPAACAEPVPTSEPTAPAGARSPSTPPPMRAVRGGSALDRERGDWREDLGALREFARSRSHSRPAPHRSSRWPWVLAGIAAVAAGCILSFPHWPVWTRSAAAPSLASLRRVTPRKVAAEVTHLLDVSLGMANSAADAGTSPALAAAKTGDPGQVATAASFKSARGRVDSQLEALGASGAAEWGGQSYAEARRLESEAIGADEAGNRALAASKLAHAERLLDEVARHVPQTTAPSVVKPRDGVLTLLVDGLKSEIAGEDERAKRDFKRVLVVDPSNPEAIAGLRRIRAAPVERARREPAPVQQVAQAPQQPVPDFNPAFELPAAAHRSMSADLKSRLQALIGDPGSLESQAIRDEAAALVREERAMLAPGPQLRSLAARLSALVEAYGATVHVALVSDDQTQVQITQIGSFGAFLRREIDLRPGEYTVVGTRAGYREVRREVTVEPGASLQLINVRCETPI